MKIAILGAGYVGLVSAACFAEFGVTVVCVDSDTAKVEQLKSGIIPIFEPGLEDLVARNRANGRLSFSSDLGAAMQRADAVMIAVGTPSRRGEGHADLQHVYAAADAIAQHLSAPIVVVTKSTVPVGTGREVARRIRTLRPGARFDMCANPEFLREGSAINDFMRPDRIVIGVENDAAANVMRALYRPLYLNETPIVQVGLETAELIKYATNAFLATKIAFINEMADLCEQTGADIQDVARGMGLDGRIGKKFLHAGPGYGGSCLPKDTRAIVRTAVEAGVPLAIVEAVIASNENRKKAMAARIIAACGGSVTGKTIAILGVTFKPNTDDVRESVSLDVIPALQKAGADVRAYDPAFVSLSEAPRGRQDQTLTTGAAQALAYFAGVTWCRDAYDCVMNADAAVILTEWNDLRGLDFGKLQQFMHGNVLFDARKIYAAEALPAGMRLVSIGEMDGSAPEKSAPPVRVRAS